MNKIRELRSERKVMQSDLANALGVAASTLSGYETGKTQADIETYCKIADYFGVSLDYLSAELSPPSLSDCRLLIRKSAHGMAAWMNWTR